jgi:hypothetical protein
LAKVYNINSPNILSLQNKYSVIQEDQLPKNYKIFTEPIREQELEKYNAILFHRLMRKIYGKPSEIESEEVKQLDGKMGAIGQEWKYFLMTESGNCIQVATRDKATKVFINFILREDQIKPSGKIIKESEKFATNLIIELEKEKKNFINPKKLFEKKEGIQLYLLHNVYLYNYGSAELVLEIADDNEKTIKKEFLKYDARTNDLNDPEKKAYIDKFQLGLGLYYAMGISYYFMSLEGFINIIYHSFLKREYENLNLYQRLDLDLKLRLMPSLCDGFENDKTEISAKYLDNFIKLKNYRNHIFHSKIEDSLKQVAFVEGGFFYLCDMDKNKNEFFPSHKMYLEKKDVLNVKSIVDKIIDEIVSLMNDKFSKLVKEFILRSPELPYWKDKSGNISLGNMSSNK